jgi:hypothetical protein
MILIIVFQLNVLRDVFHAIKITIASPAVMDISNISMETRLIVCNAQIL